MRRGDARPGRCRASAAAASLVASFALATSPARAGDAAPPALSDPVAAFLSASSPEGKDVAARRVLEGRPTFAAVAARLAEGRAYAADVGRGWLERTRKGPDGKERPHLLFVPKDYDPARRHRLVVELHGGVSRAEPPSHRDLAGVAWMRGEHAEAHGHLLLVPAAQVGVEWWKPSGVALVFDLIDEVKRTWNVDENRIVLTGFSDGASGSFHFAVAHPTAFCAFEPFCGHPAVAGAGGTQVHLGNLRNRPVYAINTDLDGLYPSARVAPIADAAKDLGAPLVWRFLPGIGHDPSFLPTERDAVWAWEEPLRREPHPTEVVWEGPVGAPSRVAWLGSVSVSPTTASLDGDVNPLLPPGRVTLGVETDPTWKGEGVRLGRSGDDSVAKAAGLEAGDVVVAIDGAPVRSFQELRARLSAIAHGTTARLTLRRGEQTLEREARFPPARPEPAFRHRKPFGRVEIRRMGNVFDATTRGVDGFELWLGVGAVDLSVPVAVRVNGVEAYRGVVREDLRFLLARAAEDDDRTMLYAARLAVKVPAGRPAPR